MALLTAALSGENEPIFMLVYTVVAAEADTLWIIGRTACAKIAPSAFSLRRLFEPAAFVLLPLGPLVATFHA